MSDDAMFTGVRDGWLSSLEALKTLIVDAKVPDQTEPALDDYVALNDEDTVMVDDALESLFNTVRLDWPPDSVILAVVEEAVAYSRLDLVPLLLALHRIDRFNAEDENENDSVTSDDEDIGT